MGHLIVVAHPLEDSVTMKIARAYQQELEAMGQGVVTHDLYRIGFDPVMGANELEPLAEKSVPPDAVREAQRAVSACDVLSVFYPLWWASMPAILKGYIDRVFARGFAYEACGGATRGLLSGRRCVLVTFSGAPISLLEERDEWQAIKRLQDEHIFGSCGFEILEHLHFGGMEPPTPESLLAAHIDCVRDCARRHFSQEGRAAGSSSPPAVYAGGV